MAAAYFICPPALKCQYDYILSRKSFQMAKILMLKDLLE